MTREMTVGKLIKAHRDGMKLTQEVYAGKINITQAHLNRIELGTRELTNDLLTRIVKVFRDPILICYFTGRKLFEASELLAHIFAPLDVTRRDALVV